MIRECSLIFVLCVLASTQCNTDKVRPPFTIEVQKMINGLHSGIVDSLEHSAGSMQMVLSRYDHCRIFFPNVDIIVHEGLFRDEAIYNEAFSCDIYSNGSSDGNNEPDYGIFTRHSQFYMRTNPHKWLREIVVYSPAVIDSIISTDQDTLFTLYSPESLALKVFHNDPVFEQIFPQCSMTESFHYDTLLSMYKRAYEEVSSLASTLGMQLVRKKSFADTRYYVQFAPLAFKDDLEICTWINYENHERMQLAYMPARPWQEYHLNLQQYDQSLHYDQITEKYDTIILPDSLLINFQHQYHGWNIRRSDLAIWFIYSGADQK
jgi:hypothetical protein